MNQADEQQRRSSAWAPPTPPSATADADPAASADESSFEDRVREFAHRLGFGEVEVPFDSPVSAVQWWFRPVVEAATWRAAAAAIAMSVLGPLFFGLVVAVGTITAVAVVTIVGAVLVIPAFAFVDACAAAGRRIAGWATGSTIPKRPFTDAGPGRFAPVTGRLGDATRWRQVLFLLVDVVAGPLFLLACILPLVALGNVIGSIGLALSTSGLDDLFGVGLGASLPGLLVAIVLLGPIARLVQLVARVRSVYVTAYLGPDREAVLAERVEELSVQRDQVLDAVASERRRIERNLHDGVQQQIVALGIDIGRARNKIDDDPDAARALLDEARDKVRASIGELRLIGRGLHPAVLEDRGLDAALSAVVANAAIPISVEVGVIQDGHGRPTELPSAIAETAYYVASEAVTNVLKYSGARAASIRVDSDPGLLPAARVTIHDDGRGGADESRGSGIAGMRARVEAVDGAFRVDSPAGGPTVVTAVIPLRRERHTATAWDSGERAEEERR